MASGEQGTFWGKVLGAASGALYTPVAATKAAFDALDGKSFGNSFEESLARAYEKGKGFGDDNHKSINGGIAAGIAGATTSAIYVVTGKHLRHHSRDGK